MKNKEWLTEAEKEAHYQRYGKPITARIPADLHRIIGDEAVARDISLADHAGTLIISSHQKGEKANAQLDLALKENELLRKQIRLQEEEYLKYNDFERKEFAKLKSNADLLRKLYLAEQPVTASQLRNLGFDFSLVTRTCIIGGKQYLVILDMCYYLEKENVILKPFQS